MLLVRLFVAVACLVGGAAALAAPLSKTPVFALEPGVHAAAAFRIVATPDEHHLITASVDKTIRIWDAETGAQVRRLVVPVSHANDGQIFALAISPDGESIAVGGHLVGFGEGRAVLIIRLRDGRILRSIPGFFSSVNALAWSPDGGFLAVGLTDDGKARGIEVLETRQWKKVFADPTLDGRVSMLAFRQDNRFFATTSNHPRPSQVALYRQNGDGFVEVGRRSFTERGAHRAYWNGDGQSFFVAGHSLLDGNTLTEQPYRLNHNAWPTDVQGKYLRQSPDGKYIYAMGASRHGERGLIRRWSGEGFQRVRFDDLRLPDPRVGDFVPLKNGTVAYVADDGTVGAVGADMKLLWRNARKVAELENHPEALRVSADERWISLPAQVGGETRAIAFQLDEPAFLPADAVRQEWRSPNTGRRGMSVLAWKGTVGGTINGVPLPKGVARERSLSVAVHASEEAMVYGSTGRSVRKVAADGRELWKAFLRAEVVAVHLLEKRGLVVAATSNGLVHLLKWSDGSPVMSYYLQPADRRWIAISVRGYFEAGIGAEDLAGWVVNVSRQRVADFFPLSRFRADYLLPGMVRQALELGDQARGIEAALAGRGPSPKAEPPPRADPEPAPQEAAERARQAEAARRDEERRHSERATAERIADERAEAQRVEAERPEGDNTELAKATITAPSIERLPPVIDILGPGHEVTVREPKVLLSFSVRSPGDAPVTEVRSRVLGQTVATRGIVVAPQSNEEIREIAIDLPAEDAEIHLVAENRWGASMPAVIRIRYQGARREEARGDLYVLAIGVSEYDRKEYQLGLAAKDSRDFVDAVRRQEGGMYRKVVVRALADREASKAAVEAGLGWLRTSVGARDTAIVFLAGHGINDDRGDYQFLPRDADGQALARTGVAFSLIRRTLASLPGRTLMFVDTCHAGGALGRERGRRDNTAAINELAGAENNIVVFASSTGTQVSLENPDWGNGAFTKALLEGLRGEADPKKRGRITYKQLDAYVSDRVDELTTGQQTPVTPVLQGVPDFVIAIVKRAP